MAGPIGIRVKPNVAELIANLDTTVERLDEVINSTMAKVGEDAVAVARLVGNYNDITGNLRSSIGYVLLNDGKEIVRGQTRAFAGSKGDGSDGVRTGEEFIEAIQGDYPEGKALLLTAGMEYASYVEDIHGKDVLATAFEQAKRQLPALLDEIGIPTRVR